jgi:hypothetical protein
VCCVAVDSESVLHQSGGSVMNVKVLSSMSVDEINEFDRLMHETIQADDELIFAHQDMTNGSGLQVEVDDCQAVRARAYNTFIKYKQEMVEKYIVMNFHEIAFDEMHDQYLADMAHTD